MSIDKPDQTFKPIFGRAWEKLPPVFQKRYANRSYSEDITPVEGTMNIHFSKIMFCLAPFFKLLHILVPYQGNNIPVKVNFRSESHSNVVCLDRTFYFPGKKPYQFNSRVEIIQDHDVVERMSLGIGWRMHYFYDGKKVVMQHKGYTWKIGRFNIPLPLEIFLGKGHAEEEVVDDNTYRITMKITHPLFGTLYNYSGNFTVKGLKS